MINGIYVLYYCYEMDIECLTKLKSGKEMIIYYVISFTTYLPHKKMYPINAKEPR